MNKNLCKRLSIENLISTVKLYLYPIYKPFLKQKTNYFYD